MSSLLKRLVQLVLLVVAVLLIRHYVFSPAAVNGSSMEPTLHNNDRFNNEDMDFIPLSF